MRVAVILGILCWLAVVAPPASAGADLAAAETQFKKSCGTCHAAAADATPRQGPNLFGIFGREAGKVDGFKYSPKFLAGSGGIVWDDLSASQLREHRPDLIEQLCGALREEARVAKAEAEQLRLKDAAHERELKIRSLLREHGLPDPETDTPWARALVSESFWRSLVAAPDDAALVRQIAERAQLLERMGGYRPADSRRFSSPRSRDQYQVDMTFQADSSAEAFVRAIT